MKKYEATKRPPVAFSVVPAGKPSQAPRKTFSQRGFNAMVGTLRSVTG